MTISDIKEIIKNRRIELGLTLKEVATAVGVSEGTVSRWESGNITNMKRNKIAALAKTLQIPPTTIMGWEDDTQKHQEYYLNPETAKLAQEIHDDPELKILMDASRDLEPEDYGSIHRQHVCRCLQCGRRQDGDERCGCGYGR